MRYVLIVVLILAGACGDTRVTVRESEPIAQSDLPRATNLPARFIISEENAGGRRIEIGECPTALIDGRDQTQLKLATSVSRSSTTTRGDTLFEHIQVYGEYQVIPADRFGLQPDQKMRVDCATLMPLGISTDQT